ncbi:ATP-binding protein [Vibrio cidicii]|uniref:PAS domain-containing sensor histidine kinase n=1 Tax=Vibrio cidicii TaxID=1763883 RepID=UPI0018C2AA02|nr:ATP-binding protein [Vibrio cidicii]MBG0754075.1 PAS domain-containing sensor histidine kinase [Vibrio cidicii]
MRAKVLLIFAILMWFLLSQWAGKELVRQWQSAQSIEQSQQRFLDYIGDVRRTLHRFYHLPYLITNNRNSQTFLAGDSTLYPALRNELTLLDKAANTKGWYLLSASGDMLISSLEDERLSEADIDAIVEQIHAQREGVSLVSKTRGSSPFFYLAAPINIDFDIVGIAVVQINLRLLTEQALTSSDAILFQNLRGDYFLSSHPEMTADWLNEHQPQIVQQHSELKDGTSLLFWLNQDNTYLAQTIVLDDLHWQLTYLSSYKPVRQAVVSASWGITIGNLVLLMFAVIAYQRQQKNLSQQRIQKLMDESRQRMSQMINKTHVGLFLLNAQGQIEDINPMAKRYFSLSDSMTTKMPAWQLFDIGNPASTILPLLKNLPKHRDLAELTAIETMGRRSDGSQFPLLFSLTAFPWHGEHHYLVTVLDISKRKKAEQALQRANEELTNRVEARTAELKAAQQELIESSKLAALGKMSSAITHELNQPLTGLKTLLTSNEVLMERGELAMLKSNNQLIHRLIDRMGKMTSQLKSFAYQKPEQLCPVSLPEALQETLRIYQAELAPIDVRVRLPHPLANVLGEEQRLRQVLGNLISNAIDAMKATAQPQLIISASIAQNELSLAVSDNGCGVSEEQLSQLFEPFATSKKIGEGLGLGLSITANNMRDMQGRISVNKNANAGLTFILTFLIAKHTE